MDQSPWHALHVTANHEKRVAQHLSARDVEHYLPLYSERSCWTDRTVILERPLFAGYVFVRFLRETRLSVITVPGVIRLLGDARIGSIAAEELERIRAGLANGCLLRPHPNLAVGTRVLVRNGVFEGVRGVVANLRRSCKVVIELSAVKQSFSLEVDRDNIEILSESRPTTGIKTTAHILGT